MNGAQRIAAERKRQVEKEGWSSEYDDMRHDCELAWAAVCYAAPGHVYRTSGVMSDSESGGQTITFCDPWPWHREYDKRHKLPAKPDTKQRIRLLEKAGALIAAEIDRLLRSEERAARDCYAPPLRTASFHKPANKSRKKPARRNRKK